MAVAMPAMVPLAVENAFCRPGNALSITALTVAPAVLPLEAAGALAPKMLPQAAVAGGVFWSHSTV